MDKIFTITFLVTLPLIGGILYLTWITNPMITLIAIIVFIGLFFGGLFAMFGLKDGIELIFPKRPNRREVE